MVSWHGLETANLDMLYYANIVEMHEQGGSASIEPFSWYDSHISSQAGEHFPVTNLRELVFYEG